MDLRPELSADVDAGADARVGAAGQVDRRAQGLQPRLDAQGDGEVEGVLRIPGSRGRPDGVAGLPAVADEHELVDGREMTRVAAVVARVDRDHDAGQWQHGGRGGLR